ncbi:MAG: hypothetical protein N5P05_001612 [Chroococcopsis gigantea SAG 12.99]|jgi:hypothetical protein|nr:hypothetical protein [Chroococcopsis gigantea SAG 12.99]
MKPKLRNISAWEQAEMLMQPAFIRVIDNVRKQLDLCTWQWKYEERETDYPGYLLRLTKNDRSVTVDIWELCYRVCFLDYQETQGEEDVFVDIDTGLLKADGDVDWQSLEDKTQNIVTAIFTNLEAEKV